ncbi:hypothetical protein [Verrucomicrobium spinosum]|uniref:hypothetical protein n=1 Tax=Verrucomicrobium spinosum TaxID=2736 RepID=UPI0001745E0A|nr:hypothetical protein [Verrucomicrobium spinosum]
MLSFTGSLKIFVALEPCDPAGRDKGFGSLCGAVCDQLKEDARNGALYVFAGFCIACLFALPQDRARGF